jgi:hypothetical protein
MVATGGGDGDWLESAVTLLGEMEAWYLAANQWEHASEILRHIEVAVASGEDAAAERAFDDLEIAGPFRAVRAGSAAGIPMPDALRERAAELIHTLQARSTAGGRKPRSSSH